MEILPIIQLIRIRHWIKNIVVLLPILPAFKFYDISAVYHIFQSFVSFCFISSAVYILNDIHDRENDRHFIHTRNRPLACKKVSLAAAITIAFFFAVIALITAACTSPGVLIIIAAYLVLQIAYTWYLKQKVLLDVICIALGFVLRATAGVVAIRVQLSPWLFICMFTLCLFMGFCKRYMERMDIEKTDLTLPNHRPILLAYPQELLIHLITVSAGIAILSFLMYSISPSTVSQFGTHYLVYTLPMQMYCIFRFTMLSLQAVYASPVDILHKDRPMQIVSCLFLLSVIIIMTGGASIRDHIHQLFLR